MFSLWWSACILESVSQIPILAPRVSAGGLPRVQHRCNSRAHAWGQDQNFGLVMHALHQRKMRRIKKLLRH